MFTYRKHCQQKQLTVFVHGFIDYPEHNAAQQASATIEKKILSLKKNLPTKISERDSVCWS